MQLLFLGTASGLWAKARIASAASSSKPAVLVGLDEQLISHVAASGIAVAAAVPVQGPVHRMYDLAAPLSQNSGLHLLRPASASAEQPGRFSAEQVWAGDARSCCCWVSGGGGGEARIGLAVGTEEADCFVSLDAGKSWSAGSDSFASAPSRSSWSFPAPPHKPHVLSIERLPPGGSGGAAAGGDLVVGIEVGGVLVSGVEQAADARAECSWREQNDGLYADIHSCRIDPHDPAHWLAVTGRGLYASRDAGAHWVKQGDWAGRYTVGLAFNPEKQGEVMVAAGDRPPAIGAHIYRSSNGGESFQEITGTVAAGECAQALGGRTPVPFFWAGQALLGTATGHLLGAADAERREWRVLDRLPHPILCMAAPGQSPSSVMH